MMAARERSMDIEPGIEGLRKWAHQAGADRAWLINALAVERALFAKLSDAHARIKGELREAQERKEQRSHVGPWVYDRGNWHRIDANGHAVAGVYNDNDRIGWWARRPFAKGERSEAIDTERARSAADAVLATWADLDEAPSPDPLTQARALLERARPHVWIAEGAAAKSGASSASSLARVLRTEIDAFLAGQLVTAAPRPWTEEQIRAALERAAEHAWEER